MGEQQFDWSENVTGKVLRVFAGIDDVGIRGGVRTFHPMPFQPLTNSTSAISTYTNFGLWILISDISIILLGGFHVHTFRKPNMLTFSPVLMRFWPLRGYLPLIKPV